MPRIILESVAGANTATVTLRSSHLQGSRVVLESAVHSGSGYQLLAGSTFTLREATPASFTVTLTQGTYSATSFATMLQTALNASGAANTYAVAVSLDTGLLTTTLSAGATNFAFWFSAAQVRESVVMGFAVATPAPAAVTLTSTFAVRLLPSYYLLKSNDLLSAASGGSLTGGYTTLALLGSAGRFTPYEFQAEPSGEGFITSGSELTVRLVDEFGTDVNLNGGVLAVDLQVS